MLIAERIGLALRARCPDANKTGWRAKLADDIGASERAVEEWCYGNTAPGGDALDKLIAHFGQTFRDEIFPCPDDEQLTPERALDVIREFIAEQRTGGLRSVK